MIITWATPHFLSYYNVPFSKINWEYDINYCLPINEDLNEMEFKDNGFIEARTGWVAPPPPLWNNNENNKTAIFELNDIESFISSIKIGVLDDAFLLNIFAVKSENKEKIITKLQSNEKPILNEIIDKDELLINLFLGTDEGYQDYILIKSKSDIESKISEIVDKMNILAEEYENELENINSTKDFFNLLIEKFPVIGFYSSFISSSI